MSMRFPRQWEEELFSVTGERRDKDCCSELCCIPRSWRANQSKSRPMNISRIAALLQVLCSSRTTEITYRLPRSARPSSSLPSWFESNPPDSRLHTSASPGSPHRDTPHLPSRETARPTRSLPFQSATTPPCYPSPSSRSSHGNDGSSPSAAYSMPLDRHRTRRASPHCQDLSSADRVRI
ncbi:MAG: hypothetical protein QOJ42_2999 [Acidobacteriaceae bacterium]|nr:hypothetical protein [Acidobacteriaceae bacterium]